ncbi:hypothetical protein GCM10007977_075370 [Dactylosporangium sucinum]|uniref:Uncharacterized protein n=1 Tax=Dactylosporangium sucinum TaxID=1424081 RepID=A0A917U6Z4_9ACTN|nr:hypothetical protein GCM10007977_075370 [Dactylosporangium sucinum]
MAPFPAPGPYATPTGQFRPPVPGQFPPGAVPPPMTAAPPTAAPPFPGPPAPGPAAVAGPPGWWRRNRWGLLLLVPMLAAALLGPWWEDGRVYLSDPTEPRVPVGTGEAGWVAFAGARMRLEKLADVKNVVDRDRKPLAVGGAVVWEATVAYDDPQQENPKLSACTVYLEDTTGRRFSDRPNELSRANLPSGSGCTRPTTAGRSAPPPGARYLKTYFFLLPPDATPSALWVTVPIENPNYARLPRP